MTRQTPARVRADFDCIAHLPEDRWNHNLHYHPLLLRHARHALARGGHALDVGCGTGAFARQLATHAAHVRALDLSPEMIRIARQRSTDFPGIQYEAADVMQTDLPADHYAVIASIATLHHLALDAVLPRLCAALKPGGVLLVLDLYTPSTLAEHLYAAAGVPFSAVYKLLHGIPLRPSPEARAAWDAHGATDVYPTLAQVRAAARGLPGARLRAHLLWRYTLVWHRG